MLPRPRRLPHHYWMNDAQTVIGWGVVDRHIYTLGRRFWQYQHQFHHAIPRARLDAHYIGEGDMCQNLWQRTVDYYINLLDGDSKLDIMQGYNIKNYAHYINPKHTLLYIESNPCVVTIYRACINPYNVHALCVKCESSESSGPILSRIKSKQSEKFDTHARKP